MICLKTVLGALGSAFGFGLASTLSGADLAFERIDLPGEVVTGATSSPEGTYLVSSSSVVGGRLSLLKPGGDVDEIAVALPTPFQLSRVELVDGGKLYALGQNRDTFEQQVFSLESGGAWQPVPGPEGFAVEELALSDGDYYAVADRRLWAATELGEWTEVATPGDPRTLSSSAGLLAFGMASGVRVLVASESHDFKPTQGLRSLGFAGDSLLVVSSGFARNLQVFCLETQEEKRAPVPVYGDELLFGAARVDTVGPYGVLSGEPIYLCEAQGEAGCSVWADVFLTRDGQKWVGWLPQVVEGERVLHNPVLALGPNGSVELYRTVDAASFAGTYRATIPTELIDAALTALPQDSIVLPDGSVVNEVFGPVGDLLGQWAWTDAHGWTTADGDWAWDQQLGWMYPLPGGEWFFDQDASAWCFYWGTTENGQRWFYDSKAQSWLEVPRSFDDPVL